MEGSIVGTAEVVDASGMAAAVVALSSVAAAVLDVGVDDGAVVASLSGEG